MNANINYRTTTGRSQADEAHLVREAREIVGDLFEPKAGIYWADFLTTTFVAYIAAAAYLWAPALSPLSVIGFIVAGLGLFRSGVFIHEIVHMPKGRMSAFKVVWNVVFGIPTLAPSFVYHSHLDHHIARRYGTAEDGEYLPLGTGSTYTLLIYLALIPILPAFPILRFLLLTPVSFLHPRLRRFVLMYASSYATNPRYRRKLPVGERRATWVLLEIAIFVMLATIVGLAVAGAIPWTVLAKIYVLAVFSAGLNWMRTAAAHRYRNTGGRMTYLEQLEDSINLPGQPILTGLLFPVGLRFHALHHLFPTLPYHALPTAHRRLMAELPEDSPYRRTVAKSYLGVVLDMWRAAASRSAVALPIKSG